MPTNHGLRRDKNERLLPSGPEPASRDPKELVEETEFGLGMPALQHRELLPEGQVLQEQIPVWAEAANKGSEPKIKKLGHSHSRWVG
jgi:hypothetical protein